MVPRHTERKLAAVFVADVAGYSRLMELDEEGTHSRFSALQRELVGPKIREHHGRIIKNTGDGVLVEFASVVDAVRCAVEIQRDMVERNSGCPEDRRIVFRIGINLGDVIVMPDDIYGDGVNVAVRLVWQNRVGCVFPVPRMIKFATRSPTPLPKWERRRSRIFPVQCESMHWGRSR